MNIKLNRGQKKILDAIEKGKKPIINRDKIIRDVITLWKNDCEKFEEFCKGLSK